MLIYVVGALTDTADEYLGIPYAQSPEGKLRFRVRIQYTHEILYLPYTQPIIPTGSKYIINIIFMVARQKGLTTKHINSQLDPFSCKLTIWQWLEY